jgi:hypothetical protein
LFQPHGRFANLRQFPRQQFEVGSWHRFSQKAGLMENGELKGGFLQAVDWFKSNFHGLIMV